MSNMSQFPVKASPIASVIRELVKVKTKGGLAGVNLLMVAIVFPIVFVFGSNITVNQAVVIVALFVGRHSLYTLCASYQATMHPQRI